MKCGNTKKFKSRSRMEVPFTKIYSFWELDAITVDNY